MFGRALAADKSPIHRQRQWSGLPDVPFFECRPDLDPPRLDGGFVALGCPFNGPLRRPAQGLSQPRDVGFVIGYAKLDPHDRCHTGTRPDMAAEAIGLSPRGSQLREPLQLYARQLDRTTRMLLGVPGFRAALTPSGHPLAHSRVGYPERACDGTLLPPLCLQFKRPFSASFFPVLRKRMLGHACIVARRPNLSY